ncbi:MAG: class I SAM-dependent methyltransferase [Terracidiphilus sp.]
MSTVPNFDRLARLYRWMEWFSFGPWLMRSRCGFVREMAGARRALVLGDGDGRFTARLLKANAAVQVEVIDASPAMLQALVKRSGQEAGRVRAEVADARAWRPQFKPAESAYDLVVTHFFLDCLTTEEVFALATTLRKAVAPGARWVVSEFTVPEGRLGRLAARPLIWGLYCAFGWLTGLEVRRLPEYATALQRAGFCLRERSKWLGGVLVSELWIPCPTPSAPEPR